MLRFTITLKKLLSPICHSVLSIKTVIYSVIMIILCVTPLIAEENIEVFPSVPYDRYIIYQTLCLFWAGIIGLIVIIRMKLKEIERIQDMGIDKEEKDIPYLD